MIVATLCCYCIGEYVGANTCSINVGAAKGMIRTDHNRVALSKRKPFTGRIAYENQVSKKRWFNHITKLLLTAQCIDKNTLLAWNRTLFFQFEENRTAIRAKSLCNERIVLTKTFGRHLGCFSDRWQSKPFVSKCAN